MFRSRGYFVLLDLINAEKNVPLIDLSVLLMSIDRDLLVSSSNKTWVFTGNVKVKTAPQELDWGPVGGGGHQGWTVCTKECRGSGLKAHVAICLKEEGSISNFRSQAGQLKHGCVCGGGVIIYCSSTRVMKDSSQVGEAFRSEVLLIAATREAQLSFIPPLLQLRQPVTRFPDISPLQFSQKCETSEGGVVPFQCFYLPNLVWAALNVIKCLVYLIRLEPVVTVVFIAASVHSWYVICRLSAPSVVPVLHEKTLSFMSRG